MPDQEHKQFPARLAMLSETAAFAQAFCRRHGIVHDDAMRLTLILEELFSNTIEHGYRVQCDHPIGIALSLAGGGIAVLYEDSAPRYDPLSLLPRPATGVSAPIESRPVGGLGVYLVSKLVEQSSYVYEDGRNRLRLTLSVTLAT
jgi:serine/threonine-protein kinase RsbW